MGKGPDDKSNQKMMDGSDGGVGETKEDPEGAKSASASAPALAA